MFTEENLSTASWTATSSKWNKKISDSFTRRAAGFSALQQGRCNDIYVIYMFLLPALQGFRGQKML